MLKQHKEGKSLEFTVTARLMKDSRCHVEPEDSTVFQRLALVYLEVFSIWQYESPYRTRQERNQKQLALSIPPCDLPI